MCDRCWFQLIMGRCCTLVLRERGRMSSFCPVDRAVSTISKMAASRPAGCGPGFTSSSIPKQRITSKAWSGADTTPTSQPRGSGTPKRLLEPSDISSPASTSRCSRPISFGSAHGPRHRINAQQNPSTRSTVTREVLRRS